MEALIEYHLATDGSSADAHHRLDDLKLQSAVSAPQLPPLQRRAIPPEEAKQLFAALKIGGMRYDRHTYYWSNPNQNYRRSFAEHPKHAWRIKTNSLGFRKSTEVREDKPDLRILFAGDSHTGGVVPEKENMVQVLEQLLVKSLPEMSVEALNGGHGGFTFYNYLGTLEANLHLKPDVFVVVGYGGNDFRGAVRQYRVHTSMRAIVVTRRLPEGYLPRIKQVRAEILSQDLLQLLNFAESKPRMRIAELASCQTLAEIKRQCDEVGTRMIYVHIPPSTDVQPQILGDDLKQILEICPMSEDELDRTNQVTDRMLKFLDGMEIETIDMRATYAASEADCYWRSDFHINTLGHRLIAKELSNRLISN